MRPPIALCWLLAAISSVAQPQRAAAESQPLSATEIAPRQILVMLKAVPEHLHVGSIYASGGGRQDYANSNALAAGRRTAEKIARKNGLTVIEGWPMPILGVDCYVMRVGAGITVASAVAEVSHDRRVAWSEPMEVYQAKGGISRQGADPLLPVEPAAVTWHLADLHKYATGRGVSVAIIDSKIDVVHPDLAGHFIADENFLPASSREPEQHGTAVAGIIGATSGNGVGIAGIAPAARLMALRACWQVKDVAGTPTLCESLGIARALQYAIDHKANVINLSLSGPPGLLLSKLISIALVHNAAVVAAFDPALPRGGFPASQAGVIAVGDESLRNLPSNVYVAPSRDIPTTEPGGRWYLVNGTSFAVAHVSGLLALVRERRRSSPLARTASGQIDACASLLGGLPRCDCPCGLLESARAGKR